MGGKLVELKNNAKLNNWYMDIQSQKQSGLTVDEWCEGARNDSFRLLLALQNSDESIRNSSRC